MLSCGVAICTYNGEKYLAQQLASIDAQTRLPDQIVICDDCSTDGTMELLTRWAANSTIPVTIHENDRQLGVVCNFEKAVTLLGTDLIFLCDQDDVWLNDKVATLCAEMESDESILVVYSDAVLVDHQGNPIGQTLFHALGVKEAEFAAVTRSRGLDVLARRNIITGATMLIRRKLLTFALPFPDCFLHDEWLGVIASVTGKIVTHKKPTILYRQHGKNLIGVRRLSAMEKIKTLWWDIHSSSGRRSICNQVRQRDQILSRISALHGISQTNIALAKQGLAFAEFRAGLSPVFRLRVAGVLFGMLTGKYWKHSFRRYGDIIRDLIYR